LKEPERLEKMKSLFMDQARANLDLPVGAGLWLRIHPEDALTSPYRSWTFTKNTNRMPEGPAPPLGKKSNKVNVDLELGENASGVIYALGGQSGGLTLFMQNGKLYYEYNMMIVERYSFESPNKLAKGIHRIEVNTTIEKPGYPGTVQILVDGLQIGTVELKRTVPGMFTASETFDVGLDLGSRVSLKYHKNAPFAFKGAIDRIQVDLK